MALKMRGYGPHPVHKYEGGLSRNNKRAERGKNCITGPRPVLYWGRSPHTTGSLSRNVKRAERGTIVSTGPHCVTRSSV